MIRRSPSTRPTRDPTRWSLSRREHLTRSDDAADDEESDNEQNRRDHAPSALDSLGVKRSRKAVHDWVQKADLQPVSGKAPNQVAVDETVIRINDQQFWLYAAANP